jgi:amidase
VSRFDVPFISAVDLADRIANGVVSARDSAEYFLSRVDTVDAGLNSILWCDRSAFLAGADEVDKRVRRGCAVPRFAGVPIAIKDLFNVAGQPNTLSSLAKSEAPAVQNDLLIDEIFRAGFIQLGRAASPELGMTTSCESERWGITRNPWNPEYSPGGSSGGSAAAVAAGIVPAAVSSDGGGSIRVPAAFCGVIGLKPSRGLLPQRIQGWEGGSVEGVITRTIEDTASIYDELATPDEFGWAPQQHAGLDLVGGLTELTPRLRIGLITTALDPRIDVDPENAAAARAVADLLAEQGHEIVELEPIPAMAAVMDIYPATIIPAWLSVTELDDPGKLQPYIRRHLEHARTLDATHYVREANRFKSLAREISSTLFSAVDVLITPTTATRVPAIGVVLDELQRHAPFGPRPVYEQTLAFTTVPSVIGSPAVSLPTHTDSAGLPLGVQLVGRPFSERLLLQLGRDLESRYGWLDRHPVGL